MRFIHSRPETETVAAAELLAVLRQNTAASEANTAALVGLCEKFDAFAHEVMDQLTEMDGRIIRLEDHAGFSR